MSLNEKAKARSRAARIAMARMRVRYDTAVDGWLAFSDRLCSGGERVGRGLGRAALESPLVAPESKALVRLTLGLLLAVSAWILVSCQTPAQRPARAPARRESVRAPEKRAETLWLKRETVRIKPKDEGSTTGSLWADTEAPRHLLADERPQRQGETVTILIPEELRFNPVAPGAQAASKAPSKKSAKAETTEAKNPDAASAPLAFTDPNDVGIAANLPVPPLASLKMQIVGVEPNGQTFLRGTKSYRNTLGEQRDVTVFAKIPGRLLTGFEVDARDLTEIALTEQVNGQTADYATSGWDPVVSRKLAGYAPDINAELQALEDVRQELQMAQGAVKEQVKAMGAERERMQKDRQRNFDENERLKTALTGAKGDAKGSSSQAGSPAASAGSAATQAGNAAGNAVENAAKDKSAEAGKAAGEALK